MMDSPSWTGSAPGLSIVVPTYNRERYIRRFLDAHVDVFRDAPTEVEIVVSDNASTDGTADVLAAYEGRPNLRIVRRAATGDAYANIMTAFHHARGRYALYVGDDDFLIPERVLDYVALLDDQPEVVALHAPWFLLDETRDNATVGMFYSVPDPVRFFRGDVSGLMREVLARHIFPEVGIYRRSALMTMLELPYDQAYWAFVWLSRSIAQGDVVFMPEPFARFTAVSAGKSHLGNEEVMVAWDRYRGGLEYALAPLMASALPASEAAEYRAAVDGFVAVRMNVAARFHAGARNWIEAHLLNRRLVFAGAPYAVAGEARDLSILAGVQSAVREAIRLGGSRIAVDQAVPDAVLALLPEREQAVLTRHAEESAAASPWARAMIVGDAAFGAPRRADDLIVNVHDCVRRHQ